MDNEIEVMANTTYAIPPNPTTANPVRLPYGRHFIETAMPMLHVFNGGIRKATRKRDGTQNFNEFIRRKHPKAYREVVVPTWRLIYTDRSKYAPAMLRSLRAERGCGRPPKRQALVQSGIISF